MALRDAACGMFLLAIIAPPEPGLEIGGSAGGGKFRDVSCAGPTYYYKEQTYAANVRYRGQDGFTVAADGSKAVGKAANGELPDREGYSVSGRIGWHGAFGGVELGAGALNRNRQTDAIPSALAWVGLPEVHLFGTLMADRYAINQGDFKAGVGGQYKWFAGQVGVGVQGFAADFEFRALPWLAPTFSVRSNNNENWNMAGGLVVRWDPQVRSYRLE